MFGLDKVSWGIAAAAIIALGTIYGLWKMSEKKYEARIESLTIERTLLRDANQENTNTILRMADEQERNLRFITELEEAFNDSEIKVNELRQLFNDHDLETLAEEKPGLIEKRINDGSQKSINDLRGSTSN